MKQRAQRQCSANDLHQFKETVNTVFKNSQEIRVRKAYRIGSTNCNKDGEQRPLPPKVILESAEQAQKLIDTNALEKNRAPQFFSKGFPPHGKTEDERPANRALPPPTKREEALNNKRWQN